jgi:hypothetical protein
MGMSCDEVKLNCDGRVGDARRPVSGRNNPSRGGREVHLQGDRSGLNTCSSKRRRQPGNGSRCPLALTLTVSGIRHDESKQRDFSEISSRRNAAVAGSTELW